MRELAERAWFLLCLTVGRMLRFARYSTVRIVRENGSLSIRKRRRVHAPLLIRLGDVIVRILDTGVRVLPQKSWEERERHMYGHLYGTNIRTDPNGTLILPHLAGETLATLLETPSLEPPERTRAVRLAVVALAALHRAGFTHADAMAENVMIDLRSGVAHWFDFENEHEPHRSMEWRRADDVRALLATCVLRSAPGEWEATATAILDAYADEAVTRTLATSFGSTWQRPLAFHLGQAGLSYRRFRALARWLQTRAASGSMGA